MKASPIRTQAVRRAGVIWLAAVVGLAMIAQAQLMTLATHALAEQHTVALVEAQVRAAYAAEAGVAVARAMVQAGRPPHPLSASCGQASFSLAVQQSPHGWRIISTGTASGPLKISARRTIEAVISPTGRLLSWRYLRPFEPAPAGKT